MKILHTSDWHLGRSLYGRKRYEEFDAFLEWLKNTVEDEKIDLLLIAGDIFDTSTPSNRAQELYYRFLCQVANSNCRHIVIIGGNHDSPSFLDAPKQLLLNLDIHIIGSARENLEDEVIILNDAQNLPQAIVCAVPYLRDQDIRTVNPGETCADKTAKLVVGIKDHYQKVCTLAENRRSELIKNGHPLIPIIAMGHLFSAGGKTIDGDGVRELYVGSLAYISKDEFPTTIDYLALGHLHISQAVGNCSHFRYSGSPLPLGFNEARQKKLVLAIKFTHNVPEITEIQVPVFQPLLKISASINEIHQQLAKLKNEASNAWLEIEYRDSSAPYNLREQLEEAVNDTSIEILRIRNHQSESPVLRSADEDENLDDLDVNEVFTRCLDSFEIAPEERPLLIDSYNEIIQSLLEEDVNAE